ncbi:MAG: PadR family transcriptional regulator [Cryobacterium sp.]|nr:PadR family transcriptional regulator [Cryobacterium sp.]
MSLKIALLGILNLAPMTGYDLKKSIEASVAHFWSADQSQIYRTLTALVAGGLAEVEVIPPDGRPDRHERVPARCSGEVNELSPAPTEVRPGLWRPSFRRGPPGRA